MSAVKRCPRCGQLKSAAEFYRRRNGRGLSSYCQPCTRAASRQAQHRRRQDPAAAQGLRVVDRVRQPPAGPKQPGWWGPVRAPPAPQRPAPGGGLAILMVVTVLAVLAAPHAKAVRSLVADGLPAITVPSRPASPPTTRPPSGLSFTNAAGCRPAGDYASPRLDRRVRRLLVAAADRQPIRVSCLRTGHSWYVKGTRRVSNHSLWRAVDVVQVDGHPVSPSNAAARQLALWIGRGGAGVQPSEVGSPWQFGRRPWFTDAAHQGHLHIGFAGPTQAGEAP